MGLPSGVLWSPVNVDDSQPDGFARSPYQYEGSFFSWGNVEAHHPTSSSAFDYDWGGSNEQSPYYEGQPYGLTPGSSLRGDLTLEYDAARVICGGLWRIPSSDEFQELLENTVYIDASGLEIPESVANKLISYPVPGGSGFIKGLRLRSTINGAILFLPACGDGTGTTWNYRGSRCFYWSSSNQNAQNSKLLLASESAVSSGAAFGRYLGFQIRPVMDSPIE